MFQGGGVATGGGEFSQRGKRRVNVSGYTRSRTIVYVQNRKQLHTDICSISARALIASNVAGYVGKSACNGPLGACVFVLAQNREEVTNGRLAMYCNRSALFLCG